MPFFWYCIWQVALILHIFEKAIGMDWSDEIDISMQNLLVHMMKAMYIK